MVECWIHCSRGGGVFGSRRLKLLMSSLKYSMGRGVGGEGRLISKGRAVDTKQGTRVDGDSPP